MIARLFKHHARGSSVAGLSYRGLVIVLFGLSLCHTAGAQPSPKPKSQMPPYPAGNTSTKKTPDIKVKEGATEGIPGMHKGVPGKHQKVAPGKHQGTPGEHKGVPGKHKTQPPKMPSQGPVVGGATGNLAFLIDVQDPSGLCASVPRVLVTSTTGKAEKCTLKNNGKPPDQKKDDKIYTGAIHKINGSNLATVLVKSGDNEWLVKVSSDKALNSERIILKLSAGGKVSHSFVSKPSTESGTPPPPSPNKQGPQPDQPLGKTGTTASEETGSSSSGIGPLVITAITAVVLICIVLFFKRRKRPQGVALEVEIATGVFPPRRLESEQVGELLAGPLAGHRVVLVGDPEAHEESVEGGVIRCLSDFPFPDELVVAIERLAVTPGLPVALLVTHQDRLPKSSAMDPLDVLAEEVEGRFPLWVVDGFEDWEAFESALAEEEEADASTPQDQAPPPEDGG